MGLFGWDYPPGCSGPPEHYQNCELCGHLADSCDCPECPVCGEAGNPDCYTTGHLYGPRPGPLVFGEIELSEEDIREIDERIDGLIPREDPGVEY